LYSDQEDALTIRSLTLKLEETLRSAKKEHLGCIEVLLPPDLLTRIAKDVLHMAETEPCGLRGALILLYFASNNLKRHSSDTSLNSNHSNDTHISSSGIIGGGGKDIGKIKCDPHTVATFQLHLTLKEDPAPWYSRLPQILRFVFSGIFHSQHELIFSFFFLCRSWTKGKAIVISPGYTLAKKKLYRTH
jgi:hypothetical protein